MNLIGVNLPLTLLPEDPKGLKENVAEGRMRENNSINEFMRFSLTLPLSLRERGQFLFTAEE